MTIVIHSTLPCPEDFIALRNTAQWGDIALVQAAQALSNSLCGVCAYNDHQLIGMARVIGDGILNIYIQDVVVHPAMRGQRIGKKMMTRLIKDVIHNYPGCTLGLMSAKGQDGFYTRLGFSPRPNNRFGAGMSASLKTLAKTLCAA